MTKKIDQDTFEMLTPSIIDKLAKQLKKAVTAYSSIKTHLVIITTL